MKRINLVKVFVFYVGWMASLVFASVSQDKEGWTNFYVHAVNVKGTAQAKAHKGKLENSLESFLESPAPIAEGDIRLNSKGQLVMAHDEEDAEHNRLTFREWFQTILVSQVDIDRDRFSPVKKKGVKLDIKENSTLNIKLGWQKNEASRRVMGEIKDLLSDPKSGITEAVLRERFIIINADVVRGPGGTEPSFTISEMAQWRKKFPNLRLSIGYEEDTGHEGYSESMVREQTSNAVLLGGAIDFNLRSVRIRSSAKLLKEQFAEAIASPSIRSVTVTIWNSPKSGDPSPSEKDLKLFLKDLPPATIPDGKEFKILLDLI